MAVKILPINASRLPKAKIKTCFETKPMFTEFCIEDSETGIDVRMKNALAITAAPAVMRMIPSVFTVFFLGVIIFDGKNYRQVGSRKGRRK